MNICKDDGIQSNLCFSELQKSNKLIVCRINAKKPKFAAYTVSCYAEVPAKKDLVSAT